MIGHLNSAAFVWVQWMGHMFWQVGLLIILAMLIDMAIRRRAWPHVRYVLWGMVFLKLLIPPTWHMPTGIVSSIQPTVSANIPVQIEQNFLFDAATPSSGITEPAENQYTGPAETEKATWQATLFLIWIEGMLFFALMLAVQLSRLPKRSQRRHAHNPPEWFDAVLNSASNRLRLKKTPTVIFSGKAKSPAVYGLFRPALVLPVEYFADLTREQAKHVLLHELCHVKRGDLWVHWFCIVLQIVYWFNPLLIIARRQIRHISEICCDLSVAYVLREKTAAYRETLLNTSRRLLADSSEPGIGLLGIFEEPFRIVARLKWLDKKTWEHRKRKIAATTIAILIMVGFVMPMAGNSQPSEKKGGIPLQSDTDDPSTGDTELYDINMIDTDIAVLIETFSKMTGKSFTIDSSVKGKINIVSKQSIPADQVYSFFESIMEINGFALVPDGNFTKVVPAASPLKLKLWGTFVGDKDSAYAIIEDGKEQQQKLYKVGDTIQNATVKMILKNKVVLSISGKDEVLQMQEMIASTSTSTSKIRLSRTQVDSAMENLTELMTQITFMPFSAEGVEGLVLSDIKANSIFRRMGLRNGDILIALEGQPLTSGDQAQQFLESLKSSDTFILDIIRRDKSRRYEYDIK